MKSRKALFMSFIGCVLLFTSLGMLTAEGKQEKKLKVGFLLPSLQEERWIIDRDSFIEAAEALGAEVVTQEANYDERLQATQFENMLTMGVDAIALCPVNSTTSATFVEKAHDEGIPIIAYTRPILNSDVDALVWHDLYMVGKLMAEYTLKAAPKGNYAIIKGDPGDDAVAVMERAFNDVLQPAIDRGDIEIVQSQHALKWSPENALEIAENVLARHDNNIQAMPCFNDGTARGAVRALQEQGMDASDCYTTGQDGDIANLQYIAEGKQGMTVYKPIPPLGKTAAETLIALAKGEEVPNVIGTFDNGYKDVPVVAVELIAVEQSNIVEKLIKPGYVTVEQVYKNLPKAQWPDID